MAQANVPATDPAVYDAYKEKWSTLPDSTDAWLARAREVAEVLAQDAAQRDQDNKSPRAEVVLLKYSGLLKLLGPKKYGGGEQPWHVAYKAIREVAKGDGCVSTVNVRAVANCISGLLACSLDIIFSGRRPLMWSALLSKPTVYRS
jgi:alkylation response protein AidB-like acyl-CoA dehydrogenase